MRTPNKAKTGKRDPRQARTEKRGPRLPKQSPEAPPETVVSDSDKEKDNGTES
ncbi:hypothetical protein [Kordiimonas sp. SCSIO 12610]|uniref:hypothetical protein n=1 Tax=Kordiimonas sp. SCSIO 12610 TaxID=2829597 RepID=UPI002108D73A|nr:hypothetical protein [Kordiimonas sp. SCSIO 12610]UTW53973.1 hypothetical protein KFF44_08975 [Kordiimonas sp. SCSIO 12610]